MTIIDDLRPDVRPIDAEWSASTLAGILAVPASAPPALALVGRPRRRLRVVAGIGAAAAVLTAVGLVGPFGSSGLPASAAQLTAEHLSIHPDVGPGEFLHLKRIQRNWGYGGAGVVEDRFTLEYWVPGDGLSEWIERSDVSGHLETNSFDDWGPKIYVDHASDAAGLLRNLRAYAASQDEGSGLHGLWTVAFWIMNDPVAPQSLKDEVMTALRTLPGVRVADPAFRVTGLSGTALRIDGDGYDPWFVVDPSTSAFRGIVGHPEKDDTWVGPEAPMWTITFETDVTAKAPRVGQ